MEVARKYDKRVWKKGWKKLIKRVKGRDKKIVR
jgi:hypothetical protein